MSVPPTRAYINGFDKRHWASLAAMVRLAGVTVTAPDYPLAPPATAATVVPWTLGVYDDLVRSAAQEGRPVVVMGDSAGAGLSLALALAARDEGRVLPDALLLLSPWLDTGSTAPDAEELDRADVFLDRAAGLRAGALYAGPEGVGHPWASPLFADLADLPPITAWCGDADQCVADTRRLAERARSEGLDVTTHVEPGMVHVWMLVGLMPEARRTVSEVAAALASLGRT